MVGSTNTTLLTLHLLYTWRCVTYLYSKSGLKEHFSKASRELRSRSASLWAETPLDNKETIKPTIEKLHLHESLRFSWVYLRCWWCTPLTTMPRARPEWNWKAWESSAAGEPGRPACSTGRISSKLSFRQAAKQGTRRESARLEQERAMTLAVFSPE